MLYECNIAQERQLFTSFPHNSRRCLQLAPGDITQITSKEANNNLSSRTNSGKTFYFLFYFFFGGEGLKKSLVN